MISNLCNLEALVLGQEVLVHACDLSTQEMEAEEVGVQGQPCLQVSFRPAEAT